MFNLKLENELNSVVDINDGINYLVLDCTGLNPPKADIFTSKSPNRKGSKYNGSTLNERSINISIIESHFILNIPKIKFETFQK